MNDDEFLTKNEYENIGIVLVSKSKTLKPIAFSLTWNLQNQIVYIEKIVFKTHETGQCNLCPYNVIWISSITFILIRIK